MRRRFDEEERIACRDISKCFVFSWIRERMLDLCIYVSELINISKFYSPYTDTRTHSRARARVHAFLLIAKLLSVAEARARIMGPPDIYVKTGSLLTLTCLMSQGPHDLGTVAWYRGNQAVVTSPRLENDVDTEPRIAVETEWSDALTSRYQWVLRPFFFFLCLNNRP